MVNTQKASNFYLGIDVGSTTVKTAVVDPVTKKLIYSKYERHNAKQAETVLALLLDIKNQFPLSTFQAAVCGSGGGNIAAAINAFFIQEVVANSIAIRESYGDTRVAIELGGQDAKVIFFHHDERTNKLTASDMRMNGSCAGGTGAFIDQIAELLNISPEAFGKLAEKGSTVYDISGRCGVFAKTDIQPLLNQGVPVEDIALSTFHAIAKQTIGGLAQGAEIHPPVIFEGGPLTFNPRLVSVFAERLALSEKDIIIPEHPEVIIACGAALSINSVFIEKESFFSLDSAIETLKNYKFEALENNAFDSAKFFENEAEKAAFINKHALTSFIPPEFKSGSKIDVYLGIDAGSTTSKFVLIDEKENIIDKFYSNNVGDPLKILKNALVKLKTKYESKGITLNIKGLGTTGYGELLFAKAFKADYHTVETVAHAESAMKYSPDVSFILDIGGQDMKAITIKDGIVTGIVLNEACSAGCGSFIETYAKSLKIPVESVAQMAFNSVEPSTLGSRCTVFMNSCIVTEQRNGKTTDDIMAGLCKSVIENVFTKVVRVPNFDMLGEKVLVQGGTFKNDAVLRALEQYTGRTVVRAPFPGEMGAIGIALLTKKYIKESLSANRDFKSSFIGLDNIDSFTFDKSSGNVCPFCANSCNRTIVKFGNGESFVTGNRCERGEVLGNAKDLNTREQLKEINDKLNSVPDMFKLRNKLIYKDYNAKLLSHKKDIKIGIPMTLDFWTSLPFWKTFFTSLGFDVVVSAKSTYKIFEQGLQFVPSDTVCFPAKLVHGHVQDLISKKVDRIFMPVMAIVANNTKSAESNNNMCAVVQGYPIVIKENDEPERKHNIPLDAPSFHWYTTKLRNRQIFNFVNQVFGLHKDIIEDAIKEGDRAMNEFSNEMLSAGRELLSSLEKTNNFAVVLAGRPYHHDELVSHSLSSLFTAQGVPVLTLDSLPGLNDTDFKGVSADIVNPYHSVLFSASMYTAKNPNLEIAQIVSFGCGHEAVNTDEMARILSNMSDKQLLVLKLDEGDAQGPLNIRVKSFIETIKSKRKSSPVHLYANDYTQLNSHFNIKFTKKDSDTRTILVPNLSEAFAIITSAVISSKGYKTAPLPIADKRAKELGKKFVHNDICYPAQINIGEFLSAMEKGLYKSSEVALGLAKNCDNCRAGQYSTLARKALDEAGYYDVPIVTTGNDSKDIHPGFKLGLWFQVGMLYGLSMIDALDEISRKIKPYEIVKGTTEKLYMKTIHAIAAAIKTSNRKALKIFELSIEAFNNIAIDNTVQKPKILVIGEILLNYHPTANDNIVKYLEDNGMEPILPTTVDFFRRDLVRVKEGIKKDFIPNPFVNFLLSEITDKTYAYILNKIDKKMENFKFYEKRKSIHELADLITEYMDKTFVIGEGWAIPAEIIEYASHGVNSFVIVQPFGCLPNHITGRGMTKALRKKFPHIQILSLDYDADTSFANIENRLQMLVMTAKETERAARE